MSGDEPCGIPSIRSPHKNALGDYTTPFQQTALPSKPSPPAYPFVPKSNRWLVAGQFWAVPLADGRFASGRVLQVHGSHTFGGSRAFFGGLHDWVGDALPTAEAIGGTGLVAYGVMHIKAITQTGGPILGCRPLEADGLAIPFLASGEGGPTTCLLRGADAIAPLPQEQWGSLPVLGYWGYTVIQDLADGRFSKLR